MAQPPDKDKGGGIADALGLTTTLPNQWRDTDAEIEGLRAGEAIEFEGEYEWNPQGGVVHWTHRDPSGHHTPGWIRYAGHQYQ